MLRSAVRSRKQPVSSATAGHTVPHNVHLHTLVRPPASTTRGPINAVSRILNRFISTAIARGPSRAAVRTFTRAVLQESGAHRPTSAHSITQSLSYPARINVSPTLLRPHAFARIYIPKAPTTISGGLSRGPGATVSVGFGSARSFSSGAGRPLFQNLVQNVPIAIRAISEVDLDTKLCGERRKIQMNRENKKSSSNIQKRLVLSSDRNGVSNAKMTTIESSDLAANKDQYSHFFRPLADEPLRPSEAFTTILSIPLSPPISTTITAQFRQPLPPYSSIDGIDSNPWDGTPPHLPIGISTAFYDAHLAYDLHNQRVKTLFARLDAEAVWSRGATCSTLTEVAWMSTESSGPIRALEVRFEGWTRAMVLNMLENDNVLNWCDVRVEAQRRHRDSEGTSLPVIADAIDETAIPEPDSMLFVMPTLDVSWYSSNEAETSFAASTPAPFPVSDNAESFDPRVEDSFAFSLPGSPEMTPSISMSHFEMEDSDLELESELSLSDSDEEAWYSTSPQQRYSHPVEGVEDDARTEWSRVFERVMSVDDIMSWESVSSRSFGDRLML